MQIQTVAQLVEHGADILPRAARHHVPLRALGDIQQPVVLEETQEKRQRETLHLLQRRGPDGGPHRQNVVARKKRREAVLFQKRLQRGVRVHLPVQRLFCQTIEADDLPEQPPECRIHQVSALGKQRRQGVSVVLQPRRRVVHRKAHLRFLPADTQLAEQAHKARIGAIVVDDKPGINRVGTLWRRDVNRCGMAAGRGARFKQGPLMVPGQAPGAGQPGDAAADNRNVHERTILRSSAR